MAILKAYKARDMQFFFQNVQNKYNMKFIKAASWINLKTPQSWYSYFVTIIGDYHGVDIA